jgi:hypothetical protein
MDWNSFVWNIVEVDGVWVGVADCLRRPYCFHIGVAVRRHVPKSHSAFAFAQDKVKTEVGG